MSDSLIIFYETVILLFAVLSAFFSGTETALVSANSTILLSLMEKGNKKAERALHILENIEEAMGMTLVGNNIANISATAFIIYVASRAFYLNEFELLIVTAVQAMLFLLLCEILPKIIARSKSESYLMIFSSFILSLVLLFKPLVRLSLVFSGKLKEIFNFEISRYSVIDSRDEIGFLFKLGKDEGIIDESHFDIVSEILLFHKIKVEEIMRPTIDIVSIERKQSIRQLVKLIDETRFSRIPVYEGRVDNIIGFVYYRDLLQKNGIKNIDDILHKTQYVPATKKIYELFNEMQKSKTPLVFVVNEYGAVVGMVTPEDFAEEIVGEIQTRDHPEEELITKLNNKRYLLDGSLDIEFFRRRFNLIIEKKGFETIAGFITYKLGYIPRKGDSFIFEKLKFIVEEVTEKSVEKVIVVLP